jgi:phosphoribosylformylglycinamidine synthase
LRALGFGGVSKVRIGKHMVLDVEAPTKDEAVAKARAMCDRLLANPVMEDFDVAVKNGGG